jgi:hypothetical protein
MQEQRGQPMTKSRPKAGSRTGTGTGTGSGAKPKAKAGAETGAASRKAAAERKLIRRLLRQALEGPLRFDAAPADRSAAGTAGTAGSGRDLLSDVDPALLRRLVADGLLARGPKGLVATQETAAWLRRALCDAAAEPFLDQHRVLETVTVTLPEGKGSARRNRAQSPLFPVERLKDREGRPFLPADALAAGERLAEDFQRGGLQPRVTASWEPRLSSRSGGALPARAELADSALGARHRVSAAIAAMGPELSGVALDVCCFGKGLETVERERQWPARSAKLL